MGKYIVYTENMLVASRVVEKLKRRERKGKPVEKKGAVHIFLLKKVRYEIAPQFEQPAQEFSR